MRLTVAEPLRLCDALAVDVQRRVGLRIVILGVSSWCPDSRIGRC